MGLFPLWLGASKIIRIMLWVHGDLPSSELSILCLICHQPSHLSSGGLYKKRDWCGESVGALPHLEQMLGRKETTGFFV